MEKNTQLTRPELTAKANGWILGNQERWAQIQSTTKYPYQYLGKILQSMYGIPVWRESRSDKTITGKLPTKNDPGVLKVRGSVNYFPSYMLHEVTPLERGTRYALVGWVNGPAFK